MGFRLFVELLKLFLLPCVDFGWVFKCFSTGPTSAKDSMLISAHFYFCSFQDLEWVDAYVLVSRVCNLSKLAISFLVLIVQVPVFPKVLRLLPIPFIAIVTFCYCSSGVVVLYIQLLAHCAFSALWSSLITGLSCLLSYCLLLPGWWSAWFFFVGVFLQLLGLFCLEQWQVILCIETVWFQYKEKKLVLELLIIFRMIFDSCYSSVKAQLI